jgi:hypothetical protein
MPRQASRGGAAVAMREAAAPAPGH